MENLKISLIQTDLSWEHPAENRKIFTKKIKTLPETDLIILPEMFTTGFSMQPEPLAEPASGTTLQWMQEQAQQKNTAVTGSIICRENDHYYNRLYFVYPDTSYRIYDKRHLFSLAGEQHHYQPGQQRLIVDYKGWKICPLICYDLRFPVWARNTEKYDLLIYIANWPKPRILHWDTLLRARSIENQCYVAGLNRTGTDPNDNIYNGHSALYDVLGQRNTAADWEASFAETFTLKKDELEEIRTRFQFLNDSDRFEITG